MVILPSIQVEVNNCLTFLKSLSSKVPPSLQYACLFYNRNPGKIQGDWKNMLTPLWKLLYDIISVSTYSSSLQTYSWNCSQGILKKVNIPMGVSLLEKQNWYYRDHLGKIPMMCWQGWWICINLKVGWKIQMMMPHLPLTTTVSMEEVCRLQGVLY